MFPALPPPPNRLLVSGNYRLSGVEMQRCGQSGVLGRYCTHFHMMGNRPDSYITDLSVHRSYQRVVSVHASNDVVVTNNVAFQIRGHAFFVEDGTIQHTGLRSCMLDVLGTLHRGVCVRVSATLWC